MPRLLSGFLLIIQLTACLAAQSPAPDDPGKYLDAVRQFADNVLKYGRDTYGPKHTPLFVDGLNVNTHEPVKWIAPNGDKWILSNLASQQNLFRTLDGLTRITGDPKYKQAAMDAIKYAFENLRSPNGLLYWGGHTAYDAGTDKPCGGAIAHEFKCVYPYYELMWEASPQTTKQFIDALWSGHILNWSDLNMNRHCSLSNKALTNPWDHEYKGGPVPFASDKTGSFIQIGSDLFYASSWLTKFNSEKMPLEWGKRLAKRYIDTRNPTVGISLPMYTFVSSREGVDYSGSEAVSTIGWIRNIFPRLNIANKAYFECNFGYDMPTPGVILYLSTSPWICQLMLGELLGRDGKEFIQWTLQELTAWGKVAYRRQDNVFIPISFDGENLEGYLCKEDGPLGFKGTRLEPVPLGSTEFWAYALAYCLTADEFMWEMARNIAIGNKYGDLGITSDDEPKLDLQTDIADPYLMWVFLELYHKLGKRAYIEMARRIGDNILVHRFHGGFVAPSSQHTFTKFDCVDPLVLLNLYVAVIGDNSVKIPKVWPGTSFFEHLYRNKDQTIDNQIIYILKNLSEPAISLQEAASEGEIEMVKSLIAKGIVVNSREDGFHKTALHQAAIKGHKDITELLLSQGANTDARDSYLRTPLFYAAENGHKEIVELLLVSGAEINTQAFDKTPLDVAFINNRKEITDLLLANGAKVSSIFIAAAVGDLAKIKESLEEGIDVNKRDTNYMNALHYAAREGQKDVVELLLENGAKVNAGAGFKRTAAEFAMDRGHNDIVELLIAKGADVSPLHLAISMKDEAKARSLIESGADVNQKTQYGTTPLHIAVIAGLKNIVELLIEKSADANAKDNWKLTPLIVAARDSKNTAELKGVVELLITAGADVNAKSGSGKTPLQYAKGRGIAEIVEILRKHGAKEEGEENKAPENTPAPKEDKQTDPNAVELLHQN